MITLRPYQEQAAHDLVRILKAHRIAYLAGMTRVGKSLTALRTVQLLGLSTVLIVTKKKAIASIQKDAEAIGVNATVTNFEQLPKYKGQSFAMVVVDEAHACFVGSTLVDGVKIKDIEVGRFLNTFNFASGEVERKRVVAVIEKPLDERLVKIKADGREIVCTESHEVFTQQGWKRAGDITTNDEVCARWMQHNASTGPSV